MTNNSASPPVLLLAVPRGHPLAGKLESDRYAVVEVHTGSLATAWARDIRPDSIILADALPDMSGIDACLMLHADPRIGHNVPILILTSDKPTPEQRVAALRAGAWDFLQDPHDAHELALKLQTYAQAKRNIEVALEDGLVDPASGLQNRQAMARRARELGALMARKHGAISCVVVAVEGPPDPKIGGLVARVARVSDIVGVVAPGEYAVLAPATDQAGAVKLAQRLRSALAKAIGAEGPTPQLRVGYDAVDNLRYSPIDPVELFARASAALRTGVPEPTAPWVRRFEPRSPSGPPRESPATGVLVDVRRAVP